MILNYIALLLLFGFGTTLIESQSTSCSRVDFGQSSHVCACNATYCDTVQVVSAVKGDYAMYTSSKEGSRLHGSVYTFSQNVSSQSEVSFEIPALSESAYLQTILGFGGAFTDAAGINILNLTSGAQNNLLKAYFGDEGIQYSTGRIPMASTDFSTHVYSYVDTPGDINLTSFSLTKEDLVYKIPLIRRALSMSTHRLSLFGSPWSAPAWMKTSDTMAGKGQLKGSAGQSYSKAWAKYFIRFLQEYGKAGVNLWGLTVQNEPVDCAIPFFKFQCMFYSGEMERDFVAKDLGPTLEAAGYGHLKLIILDDDKFQLPGFANTVLADADAFKYVSGVGVHWYMKALGSYDRLSQTHDLHPSKFLLSTEACNGYLPWDAAVVPGSWERAATYASDIIQNLNHWVAGWTDWNLALNMEGGPNWVKNYVDSPILVDAAKDTFYKQPMFYVMGHFSKFLPPGSRVIDLAVSGASLQSVAAINPQGQTILIIHNQSGSEVKFSVKDPNRGFINQTAPADSIMTLTWF